MQIKSNIEELIKKYETAVKNAGAFDFSEALFIGVNSAMGAMKFRIFNTGKAKDNTPFGKYVGKRGKITGRRLGGNTDDVGDVYIKKQVKKAQKKLKTNAEATGDTEFTEYEKKRLADGRQIVYKDLEFTGALRRSIVVAKDEDNRVICYFNSQDLAEIAKYQEIQIGKINGGGEIIIFAINEEETAILKENTNEALKQIYDKLFNT